MTFYMNYDNDSDYSFENTSTINPENNLYIYFCVTNDKWKLLIRLMRNLKVILSKLI